MARMRPWADTRFLVLHFLQDGKTTAQEVGTTARSCGTVGYCFRRCPLWRVESLELGGHKTMIENFWANALFSVTPTILMGLLFWFVMRSILRADRSERDSYAAIEREERLKRGLPVDD
jgi:hypothetical protein